MNNTDWIGSIGVAILLMAFLLNLLNRLSKDGFVYILMNVIGAGLACYASLLLNYMPFIILEGCWTLVSVFSLLKLLNSK